MARETRAEKLQRKGVTAASLQSKKHTIERKKLSGSTTRNYEDAKNLWDEYVQLYLSSQVLTGLDTATGLINR